MMLANLLQLKIDWMEVGARAAGIAITWLVIWLLMRHLSRWVDRLYMRLHHGELDRREFHSLDALLDGVLVTVGILITLAILQLTSLVVSMLTAAGFVGIVVGLAMKDVAANLVSGLFLLLDRPFALGDIVAAGNVQGTVEKISLRTTRIRSLDGPLVTVPNSTIAANAITNYTANPWRRFEIVLTLPRDADVDTALELLQQLAADEPRLSVETTPEVIVGDWRDFSVDLKLICQARNNDWSQVQSDMKRELLTRVKLAGLPRVLPAQRIYTKSMDD